MFAHPFTSDVGFKVLLEWWLEIGMVSEGWLEKGFS